MKGVWAFGVVGLRSRATGVARLAAFEALYRSFPRFFVLAFTFFGRATPDAQGEAVSQPIMCRDFKKRAQSLAKF